MGVNCSRCDCQVECFDGRLCVVVGVRRVGWLAANAGQTYRMRGLCGGGVTKTSRLDDARASSEVRMEVESQE